MLLVWREDTDSGVWTEAEWTNYLDLCEMGLNVANCVPVPRPLPDPEVHVTTPHPPADFFYAGPGFIASDRLRGLLAGFGVGAEYVPVRMHQQGNQLADRAFFFVNLLDAVQCLDYQRSRYQRTPKGVRGITRLVLDEAAAAGHHLFRVGPLPSPTPNPRAVRNVILCASEELATAVIRSGVIGAEFTLPGDWQTRPAAWRPR